MEDNKKQEEEKDRDREKRIIIYIIIIIIIILSLLTSCSCTSGFFGKIGDIFGNQKDYEIDDNTNDLETIRNKDLKFEKDYLEISLSDAKSKLGFTYKNIKPTKFTCTTSDADIATCYVDGNHVVIIPKKKGTVTITLQTKANNKIYEATAKIKITSTRRYIRLTSESGTINLARTNEKIVGYTLVGLSGKVNATSSDESIAKVEVCDGYLKITAFKKGKVTITVSIIYNDTTYTTLYTLNVINSGTSTKYKDGNNYLKSLKTSVGTLSPKFDPNRNIYNVKVGSDIDKITITAIASSKKATITYNGKRVSSLKDLNLNYGDNTVVIRVTAEDGTTRDYIITINREPKQENRKDNNNLLESLNVSAGKLEPNFDPNKTSYNVEVDSSTDKITIDAIPSSKKATITYTHNGKKVDSLKDIELDYGDNTIVITVTAEDGSKKDYIININRKSHYTLKFEKTSYDIDLYADDSTHYISYKVYKNGVETTEYNSEAIKAQINASFKDAIEIVKVEKGVIVIKPDSSKIANMKDKKAILSIEYEGNKATAELNFKLHDYYLIANSNKYDMTVTTDENGKVTGETDVILRTDLFGGDIEITSSDDNKKITICSTNKNACVTISTDSNLIDKIEYTGENNTPSSLPIKIIANGPGDAKIHISGSAYQNEFTSFDVSLNITRRYLVTINANGGQFNIGTTEYIARISKNESVDLSEYDEPYKIDSTDECKYHKFIGYSKTTDGDILYNRTDKKIISNLEEDIVLYAIYENNSIPITENLTNKTLWLTDVPLFHNEEYYKIYNKDKVIYPGASGYYIMNFKNESSTSITIKGMTLKEESICIDGKGCINMGYIIQYRPLDKNNAKYYYGGENQYKILNKDISPISDNYNGKDIEFDEKITLKSKEEVAISLFWKWVEIDNESDKLDTMIGNQAAASKYDETINDKYRLFVGLNFENNSSCITQSSENE